MDLLIFCFQKIHDVRLDERVDSMLKEGLLEELLDFHERHNKMRLEDNQLVTFYHQSIVIYKANVFSC